MVMGDLIGQTEDEIINIITNDGRPAEIWEPARMNLGLRKPMSGVLNETQSRIRINKETRFDKPKIFKNVFEE
jgi:hypothetical protein